MFNCEFTPIYVFEYLYVNIYMRCKNADGTMQKNKRKKKLISEEKSS